MNSHPFFPRMKEPRVPVWMMRQAGRYHNHYQKLRRLHGFMDLCKKPELAEEVTLGPIRDFGFDAAILFSDLLFPLEHLGMGLTYEKGPPELGFHLHSQQLLNRLRTQGDATDYFSFQGEALKRLKISLPKEISLFGFVGAPWTLYCYAVCGTHKDGVKEARLRLHQGLYKDFAEILEETLITQLRVQAKSSPDGICLFDTAAGELAFEDYRDHVVPTLTSLVQRFRKEFPDLPLMYFSRGTSHSHLKLLNHLHFEGLALDERYDLTEGLQEFGEKSIVQGNLDPLFLFLPWRDLEPKLRNMKQHLFQAKVDPRKWIMNLGHGILPQTPEENVRKVVDFVKREMTYESFS